MKMILKTNLKDKTKNDSESETKNENENKKTNTMRANKCSVILEQMFAISISFVFLCN